MECSLTKGDIAMSCKLKDELVIKNDPDFEGLPEIEVICNKLENFLKTEIYKSIDQDSLDQLVCKCYDALTSYLSD